MKTVATHNKGFHADDVFAVATLKMVFDDLNIVRTRDEEVIKNADIAVDVGRVYDPQNFRFDHHQEGGAGARENGVPYASFGLVWKEYGVQICGSSELAAIVDRNLVTPIDADDNGFSISTPKFDDVGVYSVSAVLGSMNPTFLETETSFDAVFPKAVALAGEIIVREIAGAKSVIEGKKIFIEAHEKATDKRLVVLDIEISKQSWQSSFDELNEDLLYVVHPYGDKWALRAVRKNRFSFDNRKDLPKSWAGKSDAEFEKVSGVPGAIFCHNKLFVANAKTREATLQLAQIALES